MPKLPSFARIDLWARREAEALSVTVRGLEALAAEPPPDGDEDSLNWALAHHIRHAVLAGRRAGEISLEPPTLEPRSPSTGPVALGPEERDRKRPDLVWHLCDDLAAPGDAPFLDLVVECKRLGGGGLSRLYVAKGVARFVNEEHAYAKGMRSAFMVGYLQNISADSAERGVAGALTSVGLAPLTDPTLPGATFGQELRRAFPADPFALHHLWHSVPASLAST